MAKGIGVYVGQNEVIVVSVTRTVAGPQIKSFAVEPLNPEAPQEPAVGKEAHKYRKLSREAQAVYRAMAKIQEPGAYANVAVSPSLVVTRHFLMPSVSKKEEAAAVRFEASRYVPFKLTESVLDYRAEPTHKNVVSVTVTAIREEILETCLSDLRSAGTHVLMVEPVYCSVARVFGSLNMVSRVKTCGFVVVQSDGNVNVTFASKGIVYLSRDFLLAGNHEEDRQRFYEELKASIDYFYKLTGGDVVTQIFLTGRGDLKLWVEYLEHSFNYAIRFDLAAFPNEKNVTPDVLSSILVAYGLALRDLGYKSPLGDSKLLPKMERLSKPEKLYSLTAVLCLAVLFVFFLIRFAVFQPYLAHLENESEKLIGPVVQKDAEFSSKSAEDLRMQRDLLNKRTLELKKFFNRRMLTDGFFADIARGLPQSVWLDQIALDDVSSQSGPGKKRLSIQGVCFLGSAERETAVINAWVKSFSQKAAFAERFQEAKLEDIKREKFGTRDVTHFQIVCE
ncbi:MAG TPA: pilus assembly protein PilM [Candidatus Omnitrophota bacterium]|nr:pilus assembly protein PilM [Candidatus Omnitrophota bacterium]HPS36732.1 pilus assembly protein PilM [Candidatus Omnitrophota bacterium]